MLAQELRPFLFLTPPARGLGMHKKLGGDTVRTADPSWHKGYSRLNTIMLGIQRSEQRRRGDIWSGVICLPKLPFCSMEPWFPGDGWAPPCPWKMVNELLVLLCLCVYLLLLWINCWYLSPWVLSPYSSHSLPFHSAGCGVIHWLCGLELSWWSGIKPQSLLPHSVQTLNTATICALF